jgi:hypothetical protein
MSETPFFRTRMGHQYYESTMPRIAKALEGIAEGLKPAPADDSDPDPDRAQLVARTKETLAKADRILGVRRGMERAAKIVRGYDDQSGLGRTALDGVADLIEKLALEYGNHAE